MFVCEIVCLGVIFWHDTLSHIHQMVVLQNVMTDVVNGIAILYFANIF